MEVRTSILIQIEKKTWMEDGVSMRNLVRGDTMSFMRTVLLAVCLVWSTTAYSQIMRDHALDGNLRGFHTSEGLSGIKRSFQSDADARQQLNNILLSIGLNWISDRIILRASADTSNAEAGINVKTHERFIFYSARFIQRLSQQTGDYWSLLYILAHELGHHLAFHVETAGRNH